MRRSTVLRPKENAMNASICQHKEYMIIPEFVNDEKRIKEFICEDCGKIFEPCLNDEMVPKTKYHLQECSVCNHKRRRPKFRLVKESWQEQLLEAEETMLVKNKKRKRARI